MWSRSWSYLETAHQRARRSLFRRAFRRADAEFRFMAVERDTHGEFRRVVRPRAVDFLIGWRGKRAGLRPFLKCRLGVAAQRGDRVHPFRPASRDKVSRGLKSAVEKDRADKGLADIGENRLFFAAARLRLAHAQANVRAKAPNRSRFRAGLATDKRRQADRQFALGSARVGGVKHVGDSETQHTIAEKFETFVRLLPSDARS